MFFPRVIMIPLVVVSLVDQEGMVMLEVVLAQALLLHECSLKWNEWWMHLVLLLVDESCILSAILV